MVRLAATAASVGAVAISLSGCGGSGPTQAPAVLSTTSSPGSGSTSAGHHSTSAPPTSTTTTTLGPTVRPGTTPLYVVMRMDDVNPIDHADNQTDVMNWFADHNLKYNFGIIVGYRPNTRWKIYWPTTCADSPTDQFCDSPIVQRVNEAYNNGDVVGTGENAIFEIGNHGFDHEGWGEKWQGYIPDDDWPEYQENDLNMSTSTLRRVYPNASIKYFAAPTNMADSHTLDSLKRHGLEILSAAATQACGTYGQPPFYLTPPCNVEDNTGPQPSFSATCMPAGDVWATSEGFARVQDIVSAPAACANSNWAGGGQQGITVDETIGVDDCGCKILGNQKIWCSLVSSAKNNAAKSNGLHWSVLMMHPSTVFPDGKTYPQWLDEFYEKLQALENYTVHFVNFQDLAQLRAPNVTAERVEVV